MLEQDCRGFYGAIIGAEQYWTDVEYCLQTFFQMNRTKAANEVNAMRGRLSGLLLRSGNDLPVQFNPLMQYHVDPFDLAANIVGIMADTPEYKEKLKDYRKSLSRRIRTQTHQ